MESPGEQLRWESKPVSSRRSTRFIAAATAAFLLLAGSATLAQARGRHPGHDRGGPVGIDALKRAAERINAAETRAMSAVLEKAARAAEVPIDTRGMLVGNSQDAFVAAAPAGTPTRPGLFTYLHHPATAACAQALPPDFYLIELIPTPNGVGPFALVKDLRGETLLSLPVEVRPPPPGPPMDRPAVIAIESTEVGLTLFNCHVVQVGQVTTYHYTQITTTPPNT